MVATETSIDLVDSPGRDVVAELLSRMSAEATLDEIAEEVRLLADLREGLLQSRRGDLIDHEVVWQELRSCRGN